MQSEQLHWIHLRRVMGAVLQASNQRASIWDEHQAIADAIAQGDGEEGEHADGTCIPAARAAT